MPLSVYNTLTRKKELFVPQKAGAVSMYSCGVTVYDDCHIGHARSLYIFDVIRRYLRHKGYDVLFVRNITDIDDKIINKAQQEHASAQAIAEKNIRSYYDDLKTLGIEQADIEPKATGHIPEMIAHIQGLIEKGFAYVADGDVYFRVKQFKEYGKLSGQSIESMRESGRIESDPKKEDPLDFALWKKAKPGEPEYDSPWSKGRPGWHIECSAMSAKYLGQTFDIHAGGLDLVFPHHENEIAQSEALTGKQFARYWIHHGLLTINGQKMAKSLGNFITIKKFIEDYHDIDLLKLFFLSAHYSQSMDFSAEKIEECKKQKEKFDDFFDRVNTWGLLEGLKADITSSKDKAKIDDIVERFEKAMDNDFNTAQALACLFEFVDVGSQYISLDKAEAIHYTYEKLVHCFEVFSLSIKSKINLSKEVLEKAAQRKRCKQNKDYKTADDLREEIKSLGYDISDTASNATFSTINITKKKAKS